MLNLRKFFLKIKKKLSQIRLRQRTVNIAVSVSAVILAVFLVVQISSNISNSVSTLTTQKVTDIEGLNLKGYIFRNEEVCTAGGAVAEFLVDNGERIYAGKQVANLYSTVSGTDRDSVQSQLSEMTERIRMLQKGISEAKNLSQSAEIFEEIDESYYSFLAAVRSGSFSLADKEEGLFIDALNSYMVATGRTEEAQSAVDALTAQKSRFMKENLSESSSAMCIEESCYFYTEYDGYEGLFDYGRVYDLTPSELAALTTAKKQEVEGAVGKKVLSPKWYICFPVSDEICDRFEGLASGDDPVVEYDASFTSNNGASLKLRLERTVYADSEGNSGFVMFSCKMAPDGFEFLRAQNVRIEMSSRSGYRVPTESVFTEGERSFVYILSGNTVEKRRITVIGNGNGYYIVNTYEDDYRENADSDIPYLSINELIITSGGNLYDGKLLK